MYRLLSGLCLIFSLLSCQDFKSSKSTANVTHPDSVLVPKYAKRFSISYFKGYKVIHLKDPWTPDTKSTDVFLSSDSSIVKTFEKEGKLAIQTPITKWVALSSTMVNFADELDVKNTIRGVAEPQYISDSIIQNGIEKGKIVNVGTAFAPDVEKLIDLNPDFVMNSPFKEDYSGAIRNAGIKVVANSSYLENHPLGRTEWILFMASFFDKEEKGLCYFQHIEQEYLAVKALTDSVKDKPSVFTGYVYQGIWHTPAGESYKANFFKDAGTNYIYRETKGQGSLFLDFETMLDKAHDVDYWMLILRNEGPVDYSTVLSMDSRYRDFKAFKSYNFV